eukprot:Skav208629  [mRNA]  locus=scaffold3433:49202:49411:- [translate_table: standard]
MATSPRHPVVIPGTVAPVPRQYGFSWIVAEVLGALLGTFLFTWLRVRAEATGGARGAPGAAFQGEAKGP